jgi:transcriptional regulator GlxA family with amidase domain
MVDVRKKTARGPLVAAVVAERQSPFEFAIACEVFGIDRSADIGRPWYQFVVCSADPSPVTTQAGFTIGTPYGLEVLERAHTIVVPATPRPDQPSQALIDALRRAHGRGARLVSLCTGAFTLAAAGLLDGRRATTHWLWSDELSRRYPKVNVDPGVLYIDEGDVMTSAGTAAGIDLCLHIVRLDYGAEAANVTARRMVVPPHRDGGQAQFVRQPVPPPSLSDPFADALVWAQEHLDEPIAVDGLARRAAMSPRTFARRFQEQHGTTPHQWLLRQRVAYAQRLLETTDLPVDVIAGRCGLGTATNLRQHFQRVVRTTPTAYRRTFRARAG